MSKESGGGSKNAGAGTRTVRSVERAAQIMTLLLASGTEGKRVTELSEDLGLHKTTVVRLLQTLVGLGVAKKDENANCYFWEPLTCVALVSGARGVLLKTDMVQDVLRRLADTSGETTYVARMDVKERKVTIMAVAHPPGPGWVQMYVGNRWPAHAVAAGKICLAYMSSAELAEWLKGGLKRRTRHTITSQDKLRRELQRCRRQGHALGRGEHTVGIGAVAVALWDENGRPVGGVGVSPPSERMTDEAIEQWLPLLKESSEKISRILYAGIGSTAELPDGMPAPTDEGQSGSDRGPTA